MTCRHEFQNPFDQGYFESEDLMAFGFKKLVKCKDSKEFNDYWFK